PTSTGRTTAPSNTSKTAPRSLLLPEGPYGHPRAASVTTATTWCGWMPFCCERILGASPRRIFGAAVFLEFRFQDHLGLVQGPLKFGIWTGRRTASIRRWPAIWENTH